MKETIRMITENDTVAFEEACKSFGIKYTRMEGLTYEVEISYVISLYYLGVHMGMDRMERIISKTVL
jgi:hypothetical protein